MANSTQDCVGGDVPIIYHSPRYPSPFSEIDTQLELTPSSSSLENTATTCDTTTNDVVHSQERTPESHTNDGSNGAISQDAVQYSPDERQIALNLQQLKFSHESLQQCVPSYTAIQRNVSHIRYSAGPTVVSQSALPHAPVGAYYPLLGEHGEMSQHHTMIGSQLHPYLNSSAPSSTLHPSQVPGYIGPFLMSEQFPQQRPMPTPLSTPRPHEMSIPRPFPSIPLNIPVHPSQPVEQPDTGILNTPMSAGPRNRSQIRRHICTICNNSFLRPSSLRTHLLTHSGEKPHPCPVEGCDRYGEGNGFSVRSNMRRHVKTRHRDWKGKI